MANTSVHFPEGMLDELDRLAEDRGVSRNRVIVDSCRLVLRSRRQWPDGFFSNKNTLISRTAFSFPFTLISP